MSILMQAPGPSMSFGAMPSGATYVSDENALINITNDSAADQLALLAVGCFTLSPFGGWGTFSFDTLADLYAADTASGLVIPGSVGFPRHTTCQVLADGTTSNNGTWYKTGTGTGAGSWTYTSALATSGAVQAAASAAAAAASAAVAAASPPVSQSFATAAGTYLPQGIKAATITNTGTAGTNSTNNVATFSGGTLTYNPIILYDVVGGLVVNLRIAYSGLFIGSGTPTAPTVTLPNAGTGAALALTVGTIVSPGTYYWVISADGTQLLLYTNATGGAAAVMIAGTQVNVPLGGSLVSINNSITALNSQIASLNADIAQLSISGTQYIGRPSASPPTTGTTGVAGSMYVFATPNAQVGTLASFEFYAVGAGNIQLAKFTLSGGVFTRTWESGLIAISGAGLKTLTATDYNGGASLSVAANEYMAYYDPSGITCYTAGASDGAGWHTNAGAPPSSFTDSGTSTSAILQAQFAVAYNNMQVTTATFNALSASVTALGTTVGGYSASIAALTADFATLSGPSSQQLGRPVTPVAGVTASNGTFVEADPVPVSSTLTSFVFWAMATGTINLGIFTLSGGVFTKTWESSNITISSTGLHTLTDTDFNGGVTLNVPAGSYVGYYDGGGVTAATSGGTDGTGWCFAGGSSGMATNVGDSPITGAVLQSQFNLTSFAQVVTGTAFLALQAEVAALAGGGSAATLGTIASYIEDLHLQENLIDPSQCVVGSTVSAGGGLVALGYPFIATGWMAVNPGDTLSANFPTDVGLSGNYGWNYCATIGGAVTGVVGGVSGLDFTVPAGMFFARTSFRVDYDTKIGDAIIKRSNRSKGRLAGKIGWIIGDSIGAIIGGVWQSYLTDRTGLTFPYTDARGGRRMDQAFEMYQVSGSPLPQGNPATGVSQGGQIQSSLPQYTDGSAAVTNTPQVNHGGGIWAPHKCIFKGYISGTTLTVTSVIVGAVAAGMSFLNSAVALGIGNSGATAPMGGTVRSGSGTTWDIEAGVGQTVGSSSNPVLFYGINTWTTGNTLAQDLANVDLVILEMGGANDEPLHNVTAGGSISSGVMTVTSTASYTGLPIPVIISNGMMVKSQFTGYIQQVGSVWQLVVTAMTSGAPPIETGQYLMTGGLGMIQAYIAGSTPGGVGTYRLDISTTTGSSGSPVGMTSATTLFVTSQLTSTAGGGALGAAGTYQLNKNVSYAGPTILLNGFGQVGCQAPLDGSYFGWVLWNFQVLLTAKVTLRILPFISAWTGNVGGGLASAKPYCAAALRAQYEYMRLDYCDLYAKSGISAFTEIVPTYIYQDRLHPVLQGGWKEGAVITAAVERVI